METINEQMLKALIDINEFIEAQVGYDTSDDSEEFLAPIFNVKRVIAEASKPIYGTLFVVVHTHESGVSTYMLYAEDMPEEADVINLFDIDYEPDKGEELFIDSFQANEIAMLLNVERKEKASADFDAAYTAGEMVGVPCPVIAKDCNDFVTLLTDRFGYLINEARSCPFIVLEAMYDEMTFGARNDATGKCGVQLVVEYPTLNSDEVDDEASVRSLYGDDCPEPTNGNVVRYLAPHIKVIMNRFPYADVSVLMWGVFDRVELRVFVPMDMPNLKHTVTRIGRLMQAHKNDSPEPFDTVPGHPSNCGCKRCIIARESKEG